VAAATHVLVSAPPDEAGDPIIRAIGTELQRGSRIAWIGYLSTIGVYGDHGGRWIDEETAPADPGVRGRRRLDAEAEWLSFGRAHAMRVEVFRLPGIYGPGRSPIDQLLAGTARRIVKPGQVFNRIHVDDIAAALEAAIAAPPRHEIYNLVDDEPAPSDEVLVYAAGLLGMTPPAAVPFEAARLSPMAASFYEQSKRVSNRRMKEALGVRLAYPTYREGLAALAAQLKAAGTTAP
jgi:nucleoside-diphosphate-sugar epimerase